MIPFGEQACGKKILDSHINGKCFNFIVNMYNNIKSRVTTNEGSSEFFSCNVGVRQGENLSPFLFSIFLNDLQDYLIVRQASGVDIDVSTEDAIYYMKMLILLYADDTIIFSDDPNNLQYALNTFENYCKKMEAHRKYLKNENCNF